MKYCKKVLILSLYLFSFMLNSKSQSTNQNKNRGFFNITKLSLHSVHRVDEDYSEPGVGGFRLNRRESNSMAFGIQTINGWFLFPYLSAGIGIGYDYYNSPEFHTFPVYLDLRAYFSDSGNGFYLNLDAGTLLNFDKRYSKGQVVNLGLGYKFFVTDKLSMQVGIAANSKMFNISGYPAPDPIHEFTVNSVSIDLGFLFY